MIGIHPINLRLLITTGNGSKSEAAIQRGKVTAKKQITKKPSSDKIMFLIILNDDMLHFER